MKFLKWGKLSWGRKHQNSSISFPFSQCTCTHEFFKIWHHFRSFYFITCYLCELHNDCIMVRPARYVHACKSTDLIFITFRITYKHKLQGKFNFHEQAHIQYVLGYVCSQMTTSILRYKNLECHKNNYKDYQQYHHLARCLQFFSISRTKKQCYSKKWTIRTFLLWNIAKIRITNWWIIVLYHANSQTNYVTFNTMNIKLIMYIYHYVHLSVHSRSTQRGLEGGCFDNKHKPRFRRCYWC